MNHKHLIKSTLLFAWSLTFLAGTTMAQTTPVLSASASDPMTMGWMQGAPPPAEKVIRFTDPDYFAFPKLRWTVAWPMVSSYCRQRR